MALTQIRQDTPGRAYSHVSEPRARATKKRCDASNDGYPTSSTDNSATTQTGWRRAREDARGRLYRPARPAQTPHTDASDKSLPGPATSHPTTEGHALLTQRGAVYPGTGLILHYRIKSHRLPRTNY